MLLAWAITGLIVYLFLDWWASFTLPQWEKTLDANTFIILTALFFSATLLAAIFILQPLILSFVATQLSAVAGASGPKVAKNIFSLRNMDHIVLGISLGLLSGLFMKKFIIARGSKKSVTKKVVKAKNDASSDINALLA